MNLNSGLREESANIGIIMRIETVQILLPVNQSDCRDMCQLFAESLPLSGILTKCKWSGTQSIIMQSHFEDITTLQPL